MNLNATINGPICVPNPNGISSQSPGLRGTSYPRSIVGEVSNPNGVVSFGSRRCATTPLGLNNQSNCVPRVVASLQPWALLRSPFGANRGTLFLPPRHYEHIEPGGSHSTQRTHHHARF